jgi:hypothetical protein
MLELECKKHGVTKHTLFGKQYKCAKCNVENVTKCRRRRKQRLVDEFGGSCQLCGYNRCIDALAFHHRNPETKDFGISERGLTRPTWRAFLFGFSLLSVFSCI